MKKNILLLAVTLVLFACQDSFAHCDTRKGPVVTAAAEALRTNNVNLVLIWVQKQDESIIKEAFQKTIELRKMSPAVQQAVDNYFFETLVRVHRAGEGIAYTGLKDPAEVEPPIAASDNAIAKNSLTDVIKLLNDAINKGVNEKFRAVASTKNYDANNVDAGREYVESYVVFMHYIEAIYNAASGSKSEHQEHQAGIAPAEHLTTASNEDMPSAHADRLSPILIVAGTILIIVVQVLLSRKKLLTN